VLRSLKVLLVLQKLCQAKIGLFGKKVLRTLFFKKKNFFALKEPKTAFFIDKSSIFQM
jgi:hypothetical protein